MAQVIGHKNQALINSKAQQKKRIQKIDFGMAKTCMGTINLKTKETHTLTQTTKACTTLIQKKRPSATQRTPGSRVMLCKLKQRRKATKVLKQQN